MLAFVALCSLVALTSAQFGGHFGPGEHGHPQGGTHEHGVLGTVTFFYDSSAHYMVARTSTYCYLMSLNSDQQQTVHTTRGIEDLEVNMMGMIKGGEDTLDSSDLLQHDQLLDGLCKYHTLYKVGQVATNSKTTTTMAMPIG